MYSTIAVTAFCSAVYLAFLVWYGGRGMPMTKAEAESLRHRVIQNAQAAGTPVVPGLADALGEVALDDDGREFLMVNLIKHRAKAAYPAGSRYGDDPRAADARYNRAVLPLLLKRACLPVFLGRTAGRFLSPPGIDEWDRVILVRYRSRRDFLSMCAELAKTGADVHKWAAVEKTDVFPAQAVFSLAMIRVLVASLLAGLALATLLVLRLASSGL
jgi:hypothetical protein